LIILQALYKRPVLYLEALYKHARKEMLYLNGRVYVV
jgi:hypothetical protein